MAQKIDMDPAASSVDASSFSLLVALVNRAYARVPMGSIKFERDVVGPPERPSENRLGAQSVEEIPRHGRAIEMTDSPSVNDRDCRRALIPEERHALERARSAREFRCLSGRQRVVAEGSVAGLAPQGHDAILVAHRKAPQQQRLGHREDRGRKSDSDR